MEMANQRIFLAKHDHSKVDKIFNVFCQNRHMALEILQNAAQPGWVEVPGKGYDVSADRMYWGGQTFKLDHAAKMNIGSFNRLAGQYDVHIEDSDSYIDRMVKVCILLSRMYPHQSDSFITSREQYVDMALDVAAAKAKYDELIKKGEIKEAQTFKPLAGFYETLTTGSWDATRDLIEFKERINGKYKVRLLRFNENGSLIPIDDDMTITGGEGGWIRTLNERGYPLEASKKECVIENFNGLSLPSIDKKGCVFIGEEPERGEQRMVFQLPSVTGGGLLCTDMSYRRRPKPDDIHYSLWQISALRLRKRQDCPADAIVGGGSL